MPKKSIATRRLAKWLKISCLIKNYLTPTIFYTTFKLPRHLQLNLTQFFPQGYVTGEEFWEVIALYYVLNLVLLSEINRVEQTHKQLEHELPYILDLNIEVEHVKPCSIDTLEER